MTDHPVGIRILLLPKTMLLCSSFCVLPGGSPCLVAGSKRLDSSNDSAKLHLHKGRTVWATAFFGEAVKKVMENSSMRIFFSKNSVMKRGERTEELSS